MGVGNFVIGVVGKPSAGKSSFLNSGILLNFIIIIIVE